MNAHDQSHHQRDGEKSNWWASATESGTRDPGCDMAVDPATAKNRLTHDTQDYYFCSTRCLEKFRADPMAYLKSDHDSRHAVAAARTVGGKGRWTCPMHPQIMRDAPDSCPICSMALELMDGTAEDGETLSSRR